MSEMKIPELPKPMTASKHWDAGIDRPLAGERAARLEREDQLREAFERIARLEAERDEACAALERMAGPVTDEEIDTMAIEYGVDLVLSAHLAVAVDALLALRAARKEK